MRNQSPNKTAAFFDVDGTLVQTNVVHYYVFYKWQTLSPLSRVGWLFFFMTKVPYYALLDGMSRRRFNQVFFRNYRGIVVKEAHQWSREVLQPRLVQALFPAAYQQIQQHQACGEEIVLVTGSLDFIMEPLRVILQADQLFAASLQSKGDHFTGDLIGPPISGEEKARLIRDYARRQGIALEQSYAYGDSFADLPMLQTVGYPVAVNPDRRLRKIAMEARWPIKQWR
jgi:HAD superfamily hydrolase (TIGR01490 family)